MNKMKIGESTSLDLMSSLRKKGKGNKRAKPSVAGRGASKGKRGKRKPRVAKY